MADEKPDNRDRVIRILEDALREITDRDDEDPEIKRIAARALTEAAIAANRRP